jgi:hypothetical protein
MQKSTKQTSFKLYTGRAEKIGYIGSCVRVSVSVPCGSSQSGILKTAR